MRNEVPDNAEFGRLIAFMAQNGMTAQAARDVIGNDPAGRTRQEISDELKLWFKTRPKQPPSMMARAVNWIRGRIT